MLHCIVLYLLFMKLDIDRLIDWVYYVHNLSMYPLYRDLEGNLELRAARASRVCKDPTDHRARQEDVDLRGTWYVTRKHL